MNDIPVCYYDLLEVNNDASDKEIKIAYRKQALVWHPDKNPTRNEEATFRFSKVQHAYQVLSDPQERAWYDENRDSILFGDGSSSNNDIGVAELMHYFSCLYVDYSDKPTGFYTVHRMLFEKLTKNEGNEEIKAVPSFGDSITPYSEIKKFYNFWENFSTDLEFTWYEEYNASQGPDRKARRYMEKENKKLRDNAKKEYNSTVRNLVLFIMKRDPRVKEYLDNKKKEKEKKENEKKEKIKDQKQKVMQSKLNSEYVTQDWSELNREDEEELKLLEEEWRINDSLVNSKKEEIIEDLYCIACNKDFNSVKQFEAHKLTKIHIKMIEKIKIEMMNDEMLFDSINDVKTQIKDQGFYYTDSIDHTIEGLDNLSLNSKAKKNGKKKNKKKDQFSYDEIDIIESGELYTNENSLESKKKNQNLKSSFSFDLLENENE